MFLTPRVTRGKEYSYHFEKLFNNFVNHYNRKTNWKSPEEKAAYAKRANNYRTQLEKTQLDEYKKYENDFFNHLKNHSKYHTVLEESPVCSDLTVGRKSKGGLSWISSVSNSGLTCNMHVHFILDEIDMERVVYKRDKYVTGKELRWLFRNRHNANVAEKIQFWQNYAPVYPPWETEKALWENYRYMENYSGEFSQLFNTL
ncbi:hypothetical protein [Xenorhabdus bharatensis]|uniref:hypothetical protein n=1 Tax=Xenorhabdus bharatensis TaxID=3136256 RepID=UPI0030F37B34